MTTKLPPNFQILFLKNAFPLAYQEDNYAQYWKSSQLHMASNQYLIGHFLRPI